jgi:hypothetical protein
MLPRRPLGDQTPTPRSAPACLLPPNADIAMFAGRAAPSGEQARPAKEATPAAPATFDNWPRALGCCFWSPVTCRVDRRSQRMTSKPAFASCEHVAALALGSNVPNCGHCRHSPNETLWNVGARMTAYSALMLADRITLPHFSVSKFTLGSAADADRNFAGQPSTVGR